MTNQIIASVFVVLFVLFIVFLIASKQKDKEQIKEKNIKLNSILQNLCDSGIINSANKEEFLTYVKNNRFKNNRYQFEVDYYLDNMEHIIQMLNSYKEEITLRLLRHEYWLGMTQEQLRATKGEPDKMDKEILKTKTKEIWIYGNKSSGDVFVFENGVAVKITDRDNY